MNLVKKQLKISSSAEVQQAQRMGKFLNFVEEQDFIKWARTPEYRALRPDTNEYMRVGMLSRLTSLIP